jgi:hypothetical protein
MKRHVTLDQIRREAGVLGDNTAAAFVIPGIFGVLPVLSFERGE